MMNLMYRAVVGTLCLSLSASGFVPQSRRARGARVLAASHADASAHTKWLTRESELPLGFKVGTSSLAFTPVEAAIRATMNITLVRLDEPSEAFGAMFTRNAFPGSPVRVGRMRLDEPAVQAIVVNNKISNVCPGGDGDEPGVRDCEAICDAVATELGLPSASLVFPRRALSESVAPNRARSSWLVRTARQE